jgi:thiol-disulfide isomerase/thioredoxin
MKKILVLLAFCLLTGIIASAQEIDTVPMYKKLPFVPSFSILLTDSTWYNKENLPKKKPVIIIYFNPDCGHCQLEAEEINAHMEEFKAAEIVMVSYAPLDEIKIFAETYQLNNYSNIHFGRDTKYFLPTFYKVKFTPFMAVYDKKGKLLKVYPSGMNRDEVIEMINQ